MNADQFQSLLRIILKVGGGMLVQKGITTDSGWTDVAGAILVLAGFIWSMFEHATPKVASATATGGSDPGRIPPGTLAPLLFAACMAFAMLLPGCATRPVVSTVNGVSVTNLVSGPDIPRISRLSGTAAQLGSLAWLTKNPNDRSYFVVANESLKGLINSGNYDPAAFATALQGLPIKELRGSEGSLYISVAIVVWDEALQSASGLDRQELVAATLKSVQAGIQKSLDATAPRSEYWQRFQERADLVIPEVVMPRWRPALQPAEVYALVTFAN